jgi:hypothetical protein
MSGNEKRPGLLWRLFGFGSRELPERKPVTPRLTQKPAVSTPSRKNSPKRRKEGLKKTTRPQPAKKEVKPPAPTEEAHQIAPAPKIEKETPASPLGQCPKRRASNEGLRPGVSAVKGAQTLGLTPEHIQFGMLDENPVRFTDQEAWSLVEGVWKQIPLAEVLDNAVVLSETRYSGMFGDLPALPGTAFQR